MNRADFINAKTCQLMGQNLKYGLQLFLVIRLKFNLEIKRMCIFNKRLIRKGMPFWS